MEQQHARVKNIVNFNFRHFLTNYIKNDIKNGLSIQIKGLRSLVLHV
jgi:hypothetical protein